MIQFQINRNRFTWKKLAIALLSVAVIAGVQLAYTGPNRPSLPTTRWRGHACGNIVGGSNGCCNAVWDGAQNQFRQSVCGGWAISTDCDCRDFILGNFTSSSVAPVNGGTQPPATHTGSFVCSSPSSSGWCIAGPSIDFSADEPLSGYVIRSIEGDSGILCGINTQSGSCIWSIPYPDGSYTENHWALSTFGDTSVLRTTNYNIDGTPPTLAESVPAPDGQNGWYVTPPMLSVSGTDVTSGFSRGEVQDGGTWNSSPYTVTGDGSHSINFRTFDVAGNSTTGGAITVNLDTVAPTVAPQVQGTLTNGYYGKSVTLIVGGADATSGVTAEEVSIDGGAWQTAGDLILADGQHTIQFRATDQAGNFSLGLLTIDVDGTDPVPNVSAGAGQCVNGIHTFHGRIVEEEAGIAIAQFLLDGSLLGPLNLKSDNTWTFDLNTESEGDGLYLVSAFAEDVAGNSRTAQAVTVMFDNTPPVISLWDSWDATSYGLLEIDETLSGLQQVDIFAKGEGLNKKFTFDGETYPQSLYLSDFLGSTQIQAPAKVSLEVLATDLCGNRSEGSALVTINEPEDLAILPVTGGEEVVEEPELEASEEAQARSSPAQETGEQTVEESEVPKPAEVIASGIPSINWRLLLPVFVVVFFTGFKALYDPLPAAWRRRAELHELWLDKYPEIYLDSLDYF